MDIVRYDEHPALFAAYHAEFDGIWPAFLYHDPVAGARHNRAVKLFAAFDLLLRDGQDVLASAWGFPIAWDGSLQDLPDGYDSALTVLPTDVGDGLTRGVASGHGVDYHICTVPGGPSCPTLMLC